RYLAAGLSRFLIAGPRFAAPDALSEDSLASFLSAPQELNLYAYGRNNPLTYVDPTGLEPSEAERAGMTMVGVPIISSRVPTLSDPRIGSAILQAPFDAVNIFFGCSPANAPDRGSREYPSLTTFQHTKNVVTMFGGGK